MSLQVCESLVFCLLNNVKFVLSNAFRKEQFECVQMSSDSASYAVFKCVSVM